MAEEETEITLGMGKLLGLFLMLAATCGIFFGVGYSLGKTSAREQLLKTQAAADNADTGSESSKVSGTGSPAATPAKETAEAAKEPGPDLTFYKSVKQDPHQDSNSTPELKSNQPAADKNAGVTPSKEDTPRPAATPTELASAKTESPTVSPQTLPQASTTGTYLVQIAAVSHEEDAAALAGALRKKNFAASVVNNPGGKDKFFHVVLGPYASLQDAQAMKAKLESEGYNPIVKR